MSSSLLSYLSIELTASKYVILIFFIFFTLSYCETNLSINNNIDKTGDKLLNYKDHKYSATKTSKYQEAKSKQSIGLESESLALEFIVKKIVLLSVVVASVGIYINRCISYSLLPFSFSRLALAVLTSNEISTSSEFCRFSVFGKFLFHFRMLFSNKSLQINLGDILYRIQKIEELVQGNKKLDNICKISA